MREQVRVLAGVLLVAGLIHVGPSAQALPFTGTLVLQIGSFPAVSISGSGSGDPTLPSISVDAFVGTASAPVAGLAPVTQVFLSIAGNEAGAIGTGPNFLTSSIPGLRGFGIGANIAPVVFEDRVGFPGATFPFDVDIRATATFDAWTTGVATVSRSHTVLSAACVPGGVTCPTAMLGGATANLLYFGGAAQIVLVSPVNLDTAFLDSSSPTFVTLGLNYVPEPSSLLSLVSGVAALAIVGFRRPR